MRTSNYNFDIDKHSLIKPVVIIRSGDHDIDTIKITLSNQGDPVDLTNAKVKFMGTTPAGNKIIDDVHIKIVDATSGIFEYTFPSAAGSSTGEYQDAYFSIILGNGQTSTMNFRIQVLSGVDISAPAASDYVSQYNTMVSNLNSAYDSATHETNEKMAATVSSLATSAATVLDSALARVNDVDSKANSASSAASNAVSMAASVASTVTSQANYINSVASSAASNVSSVAASVVDKLNNISVGGRNYILNSKRALVGSGNVYDVGWVYSSMPISTFSNKKITVSVQVDYDNVTSLDGVSRIGFEVAANQKNADGTTVNKDIGAWRFPSVGDSFHGRIYSTFDLSNIKLESKYASSPNLFENGMFIQGVTGTNVSISNPKIEISNIATDWTPAPEDVDNKIDNIKVGGRNLYLNSKSDLIPKGFGINVAQTATIEHFDSTTDMLHIVSAQANGDSVGIYIFDYGNGKIPNNSDWSYSADIKGIGKIIKFGIEDSSIYTTKGVIGDNWSRVSQTGHVTEPKFKTLVMYFDTTDSPLDVYIKLPKLELGNVPTEWTPAPEDVDNKIDNIQVGGRNLLLDTGNSFTGVGNNSTNGDFSAQGGQYFLAGGKKVSDLYNQYGPSGFLTLSFDWVASGDTISGQFNPQWSNTPWIGLGNSINEAIKPSITNKSGHYKVSVPLSSDGYSTGIANSLYFRQDSFQGNVTIGNVKLEAGNVATDWTPAPEDAPSNDSQLMHKTGNETAAGDKTLTGTTTLANIKSSNVKTGSVKLGGLTINFRETAVGVNVYMDGSWQGSFSMGDGYVDSGSIPTSISNPRQNVVLTIIGNGGVGGVTLNSPFKLEVLITTEGKIKYRSKSLRDNDTASHTATIIGADSTFYALD